MKALPKISIIIPTRNSAKCIRTCLDSIYKQDYPKDKIEVLIVDGLSTDDTVDIVHEYPVKVLKNPMMLAEPAKTIGYEHSTGEFFFYLDSDAELVSVNWLKNMTFPLLDDKSLAGSFTRFMVKKSQSSFNRYISYHPLQLWSMLIYLLPSISEMTIEKKSKYDVVQIEPKRCVPIGMGVFRKIWLDQIIKKAHTFTYVDIAIPIQMAEIGHNKFAYVKNAGFYHLRPNLLREIRKQRRDVAVTYLPVVGERKFHYVNFNNPVDLFKIVLWVVYVNLLIPSLIVGIYKSLKYRDLSGMYELPANFLLTNYVIYLFLTEKNGQQLIKNIFLGKPITSITSHSKEIPFIEIGK